MNKPVTTTKCLPVGSSEMKSEKNQEQNKPEPSEFAKRKKAEADRLVEQFRFKDALTIMQEALTQDETVVHTRTL